MDYHRFDNHLILKEKLSQRARHSNIFNAEKDLMTEGRKAHSYVLLLSQMRAE